MSQVQVPQIRRSEPAPLARGEYLRSVPKTPEDLVSQITTREDVAQFLDVLSTDAIERSSEWENLQIFTMLESMAAWLRDTAGHEAFPDPGLPAEAWQFFAHLVLAGKHYE
jgi:hypothetical protein